MAIQNLKAGEIKWKLSPVEVYYLEMEAMPSFEIDTAASSLELAEISPPFSARQYLEMYRAVGDAWNWLDRLTLAPEELEFTLNQKGTRIFSFLREKKFVGYGELVPRNDIVELQYFGLIPEATGSGLGRFFLGECMKIAWGMHPKKVQVNTCSLDHPAALGFYRKAGFNLVETRTELRKVPG